MAADLPTLLRSHARGRLVFLGLALAVPFLFQVVFDRQIHLLEALADHGREATATVSSVERSDSGTYTHYAYSVDGVSYAWSVSQVDAPYSAGASFPVTYLPEDPSLSRPGPPPSAARAEAAGNVSVMHKAMLAAFAFFLVNAGLCHAKLRKLRERAATSGSRTGGGYLVSPAWLGRGVALVLLAVMLHVNFDPAVRVVQQQAFGAAPLGISVTAFACIATVVLFAPYFWVMDHAMRIVVQAREDGVGVGRLGLLEYLFSVGKRHPELVRSRSVVLGGLGFFCVLVGLWIAYTAALGI